MQSVHTAALLQLRRRHSRLARAGKRVKPERRRCVGCQRWKVPGWRGGWRICEVGPSDGREEREKLWKERESRTGREERSGEERSGAFPRTVGPRGGVGCPALISACSGSGFSFQSLPKPKSVKAKRGRQRGEGRGGRIMRETFVFFSSGRHKKKSERGTTHPIFRERVFRPPLFPPNQLNEINKE